jgi:hypothetical protein
MIHDKEYNGDYYLVKLFLGSGAKPLNIQYFLQFNNLPMHLTYEPTIVSFALYLSFERLE